MSPVAQIRKPKGPVLSIAYAKARFSSVVTGIEQTRQSVTILRRGVPVAQIVPFRDDEHSSLYGSMRGTVKELGDIVGPTGEDWGMGDD
jgi:antitoxin (DNA-binding transcriptional repressor) of toxin-antitoxin stability system